MNHYVIIIGAMKSGTTTLFSLLSGHPQVAPAHPKEPGYFAFEEVYAKGRSWYDGLFEFDPARHRYRMEASTDYTKAPFVTGVWDRMRAEPDATFKLVYIMRHPLRRIESHARHTQVTKHEIGQQPMSRSDQSLDNGITLLNLATSQYTRQLDAYAEARAAGQLLLVTLEELEADPSQVAARLVSFLDIEPFPAIASAPKENAATARRRVDPRWVALTSQPVLNRVGKMFVPQGIRSSLKSRFTRNVIAQGRFRLAEDEETAVQGLLQEDIDRLRIDYGIDTRRLWDLG